MKNKKHCTWDLWIVAGNIIVIDLFPPVGHTKQLVVVELWREFVHKMPVKIRWKELSLAKYSWENDEKDVNGRVSNQPTSAYTNITNPTS